VPVNPVAQIGFLKSRDEGRAKRRPFTVAELKKLILRPTTSGAVSSGLDSIPGNAWGI